MELWKIEMVDEFKKELGALVQNGEFVWMDMM